MSRTIKKPYTKSKRFNKNCRNNGNCSWCRENRLYKHNKQPSLKECLYLDLE